MKKTNNPVAKHARTFNKAVVMKDRKKAEKKGDRKHKGKYQEDTDVVEDKKGLWDRIHAKRKRGEAPAKPGDEDYPKTLDVGEGKNTPNDGNPCWDTHKKVGTKMKNGKRVNDCVPKNESTAAYGKSQSDIRRKNKHAAITSSDKAKLGKLSDLMKKQKKEEVEQVDELSKKTMKSYVSKALDADKKERDAGGKNNRRHDGIMRAHKKLVRKESVEQVDEAKAPSTVKFKGKTYYQTGKTGKDAKTGAPSFEYSSDMDGGDERVFYNAKTKKITRESVQVDEEMSAVERRKHLNLKKRAKQGNSQAKIRLKKFEDQFKDDLEADKRSAKQSTKAIKGKGAADPHSGQAFTGKGSGAGDDDNLVSQLRKAQDVDGKMDIRLPAGNKTARLPKALIDKLLAGYDRLQKPEDKKKFKMLLTKELRKKAK